MDQIIKSVSDNWSAILFASAAVGGIIAWLATRGLRKRIGAGQDQMVSVYQETIKAKDVLATSLQQASSSQIALLLKERTDSDTRHESIIAEYRIRSETLRAELLSCLEKKAEFQVELAALKERTDFKPVWESQKAWHAESQLIHKQMLETMQIIAPVLREVSEVMKQFGKGTQNVHVTNQPTDPVPTTAN